MGGRVAAPRLMMQRSWRSKRPAGRFVFGAHEDPAPSTLEDSSAVRARFPARLRTAVPQGMCPPRMTVVYVAYISPHPLTTRHQTHVLHGVGLRLQGILLPSKGTYSHGRQERYGLEGLRPLKGFPGRNPPVSLSCCARIRSFDARRGTWAGKRVSSPWNWWSEFPPIEQWP